MNPYVVAWIVVAGIGVVLSVRLLIESEFDRRALGTLQNGRRALVRGRLASESFRLSAQILFLAIGLPALYAPIRPESTFTILVLLYGSAVMVFNSIISIYVRGAVEVPPHDMLTAEELVAKAEETASELLEKAEESARKLVNLAKRTALELDRVEMQRTLARDRAMTTTAQERHTVAAERTADATERIADSNGES